METLHTFNKTHSDYGIIIYDRALSSINPPTYVSYSNASVILMIVSRNCARPPLSHFGGQVQMSGKLFGAIMQPAPTLAMSHNVYRISKNFDTIDDLKMLWKNYREQMKYLVMVLMLIYISNIPHLFSRQMSRKTMVYYIKVNKVGDHCIFKVDCYSTDHFI